MTDSHHRDPIAIVGGGPAGATAAANLAGAGHHVLLFDEKLAWEKPCGGGVTHKAMEAWPFLRDAEIQRHWIHECELVSPAGRRVSFHLEQPVAIFSRRVLNGFLLERARRAGAEIIQDRIVRIERSGNSWRLQSSQFSWTANYIVIAAGARNVFRKQFSRPFAPEDLMVTAGFYIPAQSELMRIQFLRGLHGYIWVFPRADHLSAGICGKMHEQTTAELRRVLERTLQDLGLDYRGAEFYSHVLPSPRIETLKNPPCGDGWAFIGDAAGFVDPITGEGMYYAMRSGELLSQALLAARPKSYTHLVQRDFLPELEIAASMAERFYRGSWMGETVIERTLQFTASSSSFRALMSDMFAGTQDYSDLRRRLYLTLPRMLAESLAGVLRLPALRKAHPAA